MEDLSRSLCFISEGKHRLSVDNRIAINLHLHLNTNSGLKKKTQLPGSRLDLTNMTTLTQGPCWEQF